VSDVVFTFTGTAEAAVIRGCCGKPDTDCTCTTTTTEEN
jgi:hypothetical protein